MHNYKLIKQTKNKTIEHCNICSLVKLNNKGNIEYQKNELVYYVEPKCIKNESI